MEAPALSYYDVSSVVPASLSDRLFTAFMILLDRQIHKNTHDGVFLLFYSRVQLFS